MFGIDSWIGVAVLVVIIIAAVFIIGVVAFIFIARAGAKRMVALKKEIDDDFNKPRGPYRG